MEKVDVAIIGAGVVGLAIARLLSGSDRTVVILEKNERYGLETSSRNSEVIHSGIYYFPGSLKARLCVQGRKLLYDYCIKHSVPCKAIGKIIVAYEDHEIPKMQMYYKRGLENGVSDLKMIDSKEVSGLEPTIHAVGGILSPSTGILSADLLMEKFVEEITAKGGMLLTKSKVSGISKIKEGYRIETNSQEPFISRIVINASGHYADQIAEMIGINRDEAGYRLVFVKGEYFRLHKSHQIARLVYPLPHELGLGIHLTPDITGRIRLGPSAFPVEKIDYTVDLKNRPIFFEAAQHYFSDVTEDDLDPDTAGIRPRLAKFETEHPDFIIKHETDRGLEGFVNLVGIDSPGLTSAPAIAEYVRELIKDLI